MAGEPKARGWQVGESLADRMYHMLEYELKCDVTFVFPAAAPVSKISGHKLVLEAGSPVFEAMFSGNFNETYKDVEIVDITPPVFRQFMRFLYTDTAEVTSENVIPLMFAARKYIVDGLAALCAQFLVKQLDESNVCKILNGSLDFNDISVTENCLEFISQRAENVIKTPGFKDLSQQALFLVLQRDDLRVGEESLLYLACLEWARRRSTGASDSVVNKLLGDCIYQIRFHDMKPEDFELKIGSTEILNGDEKSCVYSYFITKDPNTKEKLEAFGFNMKSRKPPIIRLPCYLEDSMLQFGLNASTETLTLTFVSGPRIVLSGISLYGGRNFGELHGVKVTLSVHEQTEQQIFGVNQAQTRLDLVEKTVTSTGNTEPVDVMLNNSHELVRGKRYILSLQWTGSPSYYRTGRRQHRPTFRTGDVTFSINLTTKHQAFQLGTTNEIHSHDQRLAELLLTIVPAAL